MSGATRSRSSDGTRRSVLVLNAGSRTIKASVVEPASGRTISAADGDRADGASESEDRRLLGALVDELQEVDGVVAVGHRVVHGGSTFRAPTLVDDEVLARLDTLTPLAPLHNPVALSVIRAARALPLLRRVPHVACFDTAFHATLPEVAWRYAVPDAWLDDWGIRRYGFHGLSIEWSLTQAAERLGRPARALDLVVAHLGGGCSVTAVRGGQSAWTSMGLTPLDGLMMATRSGSIDPGAIVAVLRRGASADEIERTLDERSGLLAIGGSADLRQVEARARRGDRGARLAIDMFVDRAAAEIAAAATRLRRLDAIVFTGGIGEHAGGVRRAIVRRLPAPGGGGSSARVLVVETREDLVIAAAALRLVARPAARGRPLSPPDRIASSARTRGSGGRRSSPAGSRASRIRRGA